MRIVELVWLLVNLFGVGITCVYIYAANLERAKLQGTPANFWTNVTSLPPCSFQWWKRTTVAVWVFSSNRYRKYIDEMPPLNWTSTLWEEQSPSDRP